MQRINWEIFFGDSSSEEAICLFALGKYSFKEFSDNCWGKNRKEAIKNLKQRGYKKSIRGAQCALRSRGFTDYKENYEGSCW